MLRPMPGAVLKKVSIFNIALVALASVPNPLAHADQITDPRENQNCENRLSAFRSTVIAKQKIINDFGTYILVAMPQEQGLIMHPLKEEPISKSQLHMELVTSPDQFQFLQKHIWSVGDEKFEFLDMGFKNFEPGSRHITHEILKHMRLYPGDDLIIRYDLERRQAERLVKKVRWAIHDAVLGQYRTYKKYLKQPDYNVLKAVSTFSTNSDVFGLKRYTHKSLHDLSSTEITEQLLMTLQITYFGDRNYFKPNIRELLSNSGLPVNERQDLLPFEYRIDNSRLEHFRRDVYSRFIPQETCEFTRFAQFAAVPSPVHDRIILMAFASARAESMKTIFASADATTARLFKRYGFKIYSKIPTVDPNAEEYLTYLEVNSPTFKAVYEKLRKNEDIVLTHIEGAP